MKAYRRPDYFVLIHRILLEFEALFPEAFNGKLLSLLGKAYAQSQKVCKRYSDSPLDAKRFLTTQKRIEIIFSFCNLLLRDLTVSTCVHAAGQIISSVRSHGEHTYAAGQDRFCSRWESCTDVLQVADSVPKLMAFYLWDPTRRCMRRAAQLRLQQLSCYRRFSSSLTPRGRFPIFFLSFSLFFMSHECLPNFMDDDRRRHGNCSLDDGLGYGFTIG